MTVELTLATPEIAISENAKICYGTKTIEEGGKDITSSLIFGHGHLAALRFAYATVHIEGISTACHSQLVRSKHLDFMVQSKRYFQMTPKRPSLTLPEPFGEKRHGSCIYTIDQEKEICKAYENGMSTIELAEALGRFSAGVVSILKANNTRMRPRQETKRMNYTYFDVIDTHLKAQLLGFIVADGHISNDGLVVTQNEENLIYLRTLRDEIYPEGAITKESHRLENAKEQYRVQLYGKNLVASLNSLGVPSGKKSKTVSITEVLGNISVEFHHSFMRGLFDGDGHVSIRKGNVIRSSITGNKDTAQVFLDMYGNKGQKVSENGDCFTSSISTENSKAMAKLMFKHTTGAVYVKKALALGVDISEELDNISNKINFIIPADLYKKTSVYKVIESSIMSMELYSELLSAGVKKEDARAILPVNTSTKMNVTGNLQAFDSFFKLRMNSHAQTEIRELATAIYDLLAVEYPQVFTSEYKLKLQEGK